MEGKIPDELPSVEAALARWLPAPLASGLRLFVTLHLVVIGFVIFRADDLGQAVSYFQQVASGFVHGFGSPLVNGTVLVHSLFGIALLFAVEAFQEREGDAQQGWIRAQPLALRWAAAYALLVLIALAGVPSGSQFIYFQF